MIIKVINLTWIVQHHEYLILDKFGVNSINNELKAICLTNNLSQIVLFTMKRIIVLMGIHKTLVKNRIESFSDKEEIKERKLFFFYR